MDPVFIIGAPRSGTTVLMRTLCLHPQVAWLTGIPIRYPQRPQWNRIILNLSDSPVIGSIIGHFLQPWEGYSFWEYHSPGFRRPFRDLSAQDVTKSTTSALHEALNCLSTERRPQLVMKTTGWPRTSFLQQIFPGARFIHLIRDGRAVANSLLQTQFWQGWQGPDQWRWGPLSVDQAARWAETNHSFIALAGLTWEILMEAAEKAKDEAIPGTFLELRYEQLCADPLTSFQKILAFTGLPEIDSFLTKVTAVSWQNQNCKWQSELEINQQQALEFVISSCLAYYGYV